MRAAATSRRLASRISVGIPMPGPLARSAEFATDAIGGLTTLGTHAQQAAERFENAKSYAAQVLDARPAEAATLPPQVTTGASVLWSLVSTGGAVAVALFGLYRRRLPNAARATVWRVLERPVDGLRTLHSGHVGDYVAWLTFGTAVLGGLFALVYALAYGRMGPYSPRATSLLLALAGIVAVYIIPNLKYPANPPSVGEPETIALRRKPLRCSAGYLRITS